MRKCPLFYDETCYKCDLFKKLRDSDVCPCSTCSNNKGCLYCDAADIMNGNFICTLGMKVNI